MMYKNLTTDEIMQLEFQAGKKATELIDGIKESMKDKLDVKLSAEDNGKILQVGADGKVTPMAPASGLTIDDTLSVQGAAADAKKVGDEIADLKSAINFEVALDNYTEVQLFAKADGKYTSTGTSKNIPIIGQLYETITLTANVNGTGVCFITHTRGSNGNTVPVVEGDVRHWISGGKTVTLKIPKACNFINISTSYTTTDYTPTNVYLSNYAESNYILTSLANSYDFNLWFSCSKNNSQALYSQSGVLTYNSSYDTSDYIPVISGDLLVGRGARYCFYDSDKVFISGATGLLTDGTSIGNSMYYITVPGGASYIRISAERENNINQYILFKANQIEKTLLLGNEAEIKLYCIGDSITKGMYAEIGTSSSSGPTVYNYPYWVSKINNFSIVNLGESGAGYANKGTDTASNGKDIIDNNSFDDADIITIALGVNDWIGDNIALGSMQSASGDGTVIGNMKYMIETLADPTNGKAKKAQIIVMLPMNTNRVFSGMDSSQITLANNWAFGYAYRNSQTLEDYRDAIRECAEYYNVKIIDLEEVCPINRLNIRQVIGDGLHPTIAFYKQMGMALAPLIH